MIIQNNRILEIHPDYISELEKFENLEEQLLLKM